MRVKLLQSLIITVGMIKLTIRQLRITLKNFKYLNNLIKEKEDTVMKYNIINNRITNNKMRL